MKYTPVIGLEVHVELKTNSKMFCSCSADYFGQKPNTHTCPVCLGLPGALPFPNKKAIEWCVMIGLSLNCEIPLFSKFDRKNYFYPDLSKGYQISQYDKPFCLNGHITLSNGKKIGITRVHMEEDTGKLIHEKVNGESVSLIDFNRSGVPLVEIVTEPDFETAEEVKEYLQKLQQIVRYLEVSNADMEKGNMRLEPNISLKKPTDKGLPKYKVEVKNINSFSFVGKAIDFELKRQAEILNEGKTPVQETRGYVEKSSSTVSQRVKEEASDYRYFPEPDIPPIRWTNDKVDELKKQVLEKYKTSPENRIKEYEKLGISNASASSIAMSEIRTEKFEPFVKENKNLIDVSKYIANLSEDTLSSLSMKTIYDNVINATTKVTIDDNELSSVINKVLSENEKAVEDFKKGKETVIMYLVGQVMRQFKQKIDANKVKASLLAKLK